MQEIIEKLPLKSKEDKQKDCISHFALRLAFLKQPEEQHWFIRQESTLLRYRLENLLKRGKLDTASLLEGSGIKYPSIDDETFNKYKSQLENLLPFQIKRDPNRPPLSVSDYYVVPFERALDLVSRRKCLLVEGNAFVYSGDLIGIVLSHFQTKLQESLQAARASVPPTTNVDEDDRVGVLLSQLTQRRLTLAASTSEMNSWKSDNFDISKIDSISQRDFPLCMQHLHLQLRKSHKLKHMGRMQYGLFLKGLGISLEDSLFFWKQEFTRVMTQKQFDQEYAYNIRHNYGQEGRRADYTPYGCAKIINSAGSDLAADQAHGCPFKTFSQAQLTNQLQAVGASMADQSELFQHVQEKRYQVFIYSNISLLISNYFPFFFFKKLGCKKYFELTHPGCKKQFLINHPNQYFKYSASYWEDKKPQ